MMAACLLLLLCDFVSAQTGKDVSNLYDYLFSTLNYNKEIRPAIYQNKSTQVEVDLLLSGLHHIDETHQQMTSVGVLTVRWKDEFLTWDPSLFGRANFIDVPQGKIWKPDLQVRNGFADFSQMGGDFMFLKIYHTGEVVWFLHKVFHTKCKMNVTFFPFDRQNCSLQIISWSNDVSSVNITGGGDGFRIDADLHHGHWKISTYSFSTFMDVNDSVISFSITLDRKPKIYILNILIPVCFLVVLSLLTFLLPNDCGEKVSYSITVLLSMSIFLTVVASMLPTNSDSISYLEIYIIAVLSVGVLIIVLSTASLRLHYRTEKRKIPDWVQRLTRLSWTLRCQRIDGYNAQYNYRTKTKEHFDDKQERKEPQKSDIVVRWTDVTSALDFYMFWLFLTAITALSLAVTWLYFSQ